MLCGIAALCAGQANAFAAPLGNNKDALFQLVQEQARSLAETQFQPPMQMPPQLAKLGYDQYRNIRFRREKALLGEQGGLFRLEFFHRGPLAPQSVQMNVVRDGEIRRVSYSPDLFTYGSNVETEGLPADLGFAGLRLLFPLNSPLLDDELIVFLGASYFRFLGRGQKFGMSARMLAVNAGRSPEEFPFFREFWIVEPPAGQETVSIYGLLDSASVAGAYRMDVTPGEETAVEVKCVLFPRSTIACLGVAPLTSMFFVGRSETRLHDSFRPEVHDSMTLVRAGWGRAHLAPSAQSTGINNHSLARSESERLRTAAAQPQLV